MGRIRPNDFERLELEFTCYPGCGAQPGQWCLTRWGNWADLLHSARSSQALVVLARRRRTG